MTVYAVCEIEPESDYPFVVNYIFTNEELAAEYVRAKEEERDADPDNDRTEDDLYWEIHHHDVLDHMPVECGVMPPLGRNS